MSAADLAARVASLEAQLAELVADVAQVPAVAARRATRVQAEQVARLRAVESIADGDARGEAYLRLPHLERKRCADHCKDPIAFVRGLDAVARMAFLEHLEPRRRVHVVVSLIPAAERLLVLPGGGASKAATSAVAVDSEVASALDAAGVQVERDAFGHPSLPAWVVADCGAVVTAAEWRARLAASAELREMLASGQVVATPLDDAASRAIDASEYNRPGGPPLPNLSA